MNCALWSLSLPLFCGQRSTAITDCQAVVVAGDDVIAARSYFVAAFCMLLGLASAVRSGSELSSNQLPVFGGRTCPCEVSHQLRLLDIAVPGKK